MVQRVGLRGRGASEIYGRRTRTKKDNHPVVGEV